MSTEARLYAIRDYLWWRTYRRPFWLVVTTTGQNLLYMTNPRKQYEQIKAVYARYSVAE